MNANRHYEKIQKAAVELGNELGASIVIVAYDNSGPYCTTEVGANMNYRATAPILHDACTKILHLSLPNKPPAQEAA